MTDKTKLELISKAKDIVFDADRKFKSDVAAVIQEALAAYAEQLEGGDEVSVGDHISFGDDHEWERRVAKIEDGILVLETPEQHNGKSYFAAGSEIARKLLPQPPKEDE